MTQTRPEEIDNVHYITSSPPARHALLPLGVTVLSFSASVLSRLHLISSSQLFPSVPAGRWLSLDVLKETESVGVSTVCSVSWIRRPGDDWRWSISCFSRLRGALSSELELQIVSSDALWSFRSCLALQFSSHLCFFISLLDPGGLKVPQVFAGVSFLLEIARQTFRFLWFREAA